MKQGNHISAYTTHNEETIFCDLLTSLFNLICFLFVFIWFLLVFICFLFEFRADTQAQNALGQTALDIASFWNHSDLMRILQRLPDDNRPSEPVHFFSTNHIDRMSWRRKETAWLDDALTTNPDTVVYVFINKFPVVEGQRLAEFTYKEIKHLLNGRKCNSELIFLGAEETTKKYLFALNLHAESGTYSSSMPSSLSAYSFTDKKSQLDYVQLYM